MKVFKVVVIAMALSVTACQKEKTAPIETQEQIAERTKQYDLWREEALKKAFTQGEKERVCAAVKAGKYEELKEVQFNDLGIDKAKYDAALKKYVIGFGWEADRAKLYKANYDNSGKEKILFRALYDSFKDVDRWCQRYEYLVYDDTQDKFTFFNGLKNWSEWSLSGGVDIGCRGEGVRIVKIEDDYYVLTYKIDPDYLKRAPYSLQHPPEVDKSEIGKIKISKYYNYKDTIFSFPVCNIDIKEVPK